MESGYNLSNIRKSNRFLGRLPRKAVYGLLAVALLLGGFFWHGMSGVRAATIDLINSTFEDPTEVVNWSVYGETNATVSVSSSVYNHTPGGSHSARIETEASGSAVATKGAIKRPFKMPSGTINNVALSVYYSHSSAESLELKWKIMNSDESGEPVAQGTITTNASETPPWTYFEVDAITGLLPSYNYVLVIEADGVTTAEAGSALTVDFDDIILKAQYEAVPSRITVAASAYSIPNNGITTTTVTATVYDQNNQLLNGEDVTFTKNKSWGSFTNSETSETVSTIDGKASVTFKSDTGGDIAITATAGSQSDAANITVLYPDSISISSSRSTIPINDTTVEPPRYYPAKIIARVLDQKGNPLQNVRVDFSKNSTYANLAPAFEMTDAKGEAHASFSSNVGETVIITAKANQSPTDTITKDTTVIVQEPSTLALTVDKSTIPNDGSTTVTVTAELKDQNQQFMNGELIDFTVSPGGGQLASATAVTKSNGTAQVTFNSTVGETYTITGKVHRKNMITAAASVKVAAPTTLSLQVPSPSTILNDNKSLAVITATLTDQEGMAIKGEKINFTSDIGGFEGAYTDLATDANGKVTVRFKSGTAGTAKVTGSVARLTDIKGSTNVIVEEPVPATMVVKTSAISIPDDNSTSATVTATVYDQYNRVMSGREVTFSKSPDQGSFTPISGVTSTNGSGTAAIQFKSDKAGTYTITASTGSLSQNITVDVLARTSKDLTLTASSATVPDDGTTVTTITAQLFDQFGKPFVNQAVHFSKNQSWGTLSAEDVMTDNSGKAVITFRSTVSGVVVITAAAGTASDQQEITVQQRMASILSLNASSVLIVPGESSTVVAHLTDQFGMPIPDKQVSFTTGLGKLSATTALTNASGDATVTLSSLLSPEQIGTTIITAKVNGMPMVTGMVTIELRSSDTTPPTLLKAEATSKQVFYLTFSEKVKFKAYPPVGWTLKKYVGESVYSVPINDPVILSSDNRIVRVTLNGEDMAVGNQYPNPVRYEITVGDVTDLAGKEIDPDFRTASFDAFTPHGKYAPFPVAAGNSTRICAQCHSPHKAAGEKLLTSSTVKKVCFVCHGTTGMSEYRVEADFYRGDGGNYSLSMHKALDADAPGMDTLTCVDCHVAHGIRRANTNEIWPKLLRVRNALGQQFTSEDGNKFCLACHGEEETSSKFGDSWLETAGNHSDGMNVVEDVYNSAHYDGRFNSLKSNSGFENTCLSCHEQHGSKNPGLVDNGVMDSPEQLCYKCHSADVKPKFDKASKHNIFDPAGVGLSCRSCHEPHSVAARSFEESGSNKPSDISDPSNTKNNWYRDSEKNLSEFCLKCHNTDQGVILEKTKNASTLIPFTVSLPDLPFANGTGWNKSQFKTSGHYSKGIYCENCHDPHGSENSSLQLRSEDTAANKLEGECLSCHGDNNIETGPEVYSGQFDKTYSHPTLDEGKSGKHSNKEDYAKIDSADRHAECVDCHDPHTANSSNKLGKVSGVKFSQVPWDNQVSPSVTEIKLGNGSNDRQAYLCYKCHSSYSPGSQTDVARAMNSGNAARHVVEGSSEMPKFTLDNSTYYYGNFRDGWSATSDMKCTDCHSSSDSTGPHGSTNRFILRKPWNNDTGKSGTQGDLCFTCHDYSFYAGGDAGGIDKERSQFSSDTSYNLHAAPAHMNVGCASCHGSDAHGWKGTDASGEGLSLKEGLMSAESGGLPATWQYNSCVTSCHTEPSQSEGSGS